MKLLPFIILSLAALGGCSSGTAPGAPTFAVELRASSQDGQPLAGVSFTIDQRVVGLTRADGRLVHAVRGTEGGLAKLVVACPAEFEPPPQPAPLRLTRTRAIDGEATQPLTVDVRCQKRLRDVVLIVHAERGDHLPVLVDGKPVGTTDDDGIAHVLLRRPREDKSVQLGVDTTSRPALKPVSPSRSYQLTGQDAVVLFEPSFVVAVAPAARIAAPRRHIPVRVY